MNEVPRHFSLLLSRPEPWMRQTKPEIIMASGACLARNPASLPFPCNCASEQLDDFRQKLLLFLHENFPGSLPLGVFPLRELTPFLRALLTERKLLNVSSSVPPGTASPARTLILSPDRTLDLLLHEKDHCLIRRSAPGLALGGLLEELSAFDEAFTAAIPCAYHKRLGFLSADPQNSGTAFHATVLLHLPALVLSGKESVLRESLPALGLKLKNWYGNENDFIGSFFELSNAAAIGESEEEIVGRLERIARELEKEELRSREQLLRLQKRLLFDTVFRAGAILANAYRISTREAMTLLSALELGLACGCFDADPSPLPLPRTFLTLIHPAHLAMNARRELDAEERSAERADLLRRNFGEKTDSKAQE